MNFIQFCIRHPIPVIVGVILVILFGVIAMFQIPRQLTPTVEVPVVGVSVVYPGAAPQEVESTIVERIEEQLNAVDGMREMTSTSSENVADIQLEFDWGTDRSLVGVDVNNKLNLVSDLPKDADKPVIYFGERMAHPIAFVSLVGKGKNSDELRQYAVDVLQPYFKRISGVSRVDVYGGRQREAVVTFDPYRLASYHVTPMELGQILTMENRNTPGGRINEETARFPVRTVGEYLTNADIEATIVKRPGLPDVRLADLIKADVDGYKDADSFVRIDGSSGLVFAIQKKTGENVVNIIRDVYKTVDQLNEGMLKRQEMKLAVEYDEATYIDQAIELLKGDVWLSALLAGAVLIFFLRSVRAIVTICVAIPISFVGTFIFLWLMGRTLNVISLAGLTFAVGRLVDDSIVVLENIYRHREMGKSAMQAALDGTREVWLAVLASTLTTVAVFVPVLFIKEEAGQLFRDISLAIAISVALSMVVSVTVVPMLTSRILRTGKSLEGSNTGWSGWVGKWLLFGWLGSGFRRVAMGLIRWVLNTTPRRVATAAIIFGVFGSALVWFAYNTPTSYLPSGNQNFVLGYVVTEAGASVDHNLIVAKDIERRIRGIDGQVKGLPQVDRFFIVAMQDFMIFGARSAESSKARDMASAIQTRVGSPPLAWIPEPYREGFWKKFGEYYEPPIPGITVLAFQVGLFQSKGMVGGQSVTVTIRGDDLDELYRIAATMQPMLAKTDGVQAIVPGFKLGNWELRPTMDRRAAADVGMTASDVGYTVASYVNGVKVADYRQSNGRQIDMTLRADEKVREHIEQLGDVPVWTPAGQMVTLGHVAPIEQASGFSSIDRTDQRRCVKIDCYTAADAPIGAVVEQIRSNVIAPMEKDGSIPANYVVDLRGTAKDLDRMWSAMQWSFLLAMVITYLLMAALFESFSEPLVIILSVPLAVVGGFAMLLFMQLWNVIVTDQSPPMLDVVTMLGFIIMIGIIVNNAILVVAQAMNFMRNEKLPLREAVIASVDSRLRPIFMSTLTSMLGMLPLVFRPGPGSELYQGLGSVIVGGLLVSTVFTLILTPILFTFGHSFKAAMHRLMVAAHVLAEAEPEGNGDG
jgi:hydrophobic/amphiphilic exporter-1 (mainly G- bacteria), HAE1 family